MKLSNTLKNFFVDYAQWIAFGAHKEDNKLFTRSEGLCLNYKNYIESQGHTYFLGVFYEEFKHLRIQEFTALTSNGSISYPFGGIKLYKEESRDKVCHLNKDRVRFVQKITTEILEGKR